jgi:hypothetical protein
MKKVFLPVAAILLFAILGYTSCVKKEFDSPPDTTLNDPNLPVNKTIWELKQMYTGVPTLIEDDITVAGVVVADDRSGNFYKQIIIQDTSSGMPVLINRSGLYSDFPIGRKVYIKCKGLYLGAYGGMVQIGHTPDNNNEISSIPSGLISKYVIKGKFDLSQVTARKVSIMELNNLNSSIKWLGTLILENHRVPSFGNCSGGFRSEVMIFPSRSANGLCFDANLGTIWIQNGQRLQRSRKIVDGGITIANKQNAQ